VLCPPFGIDVEAKKFFRQFRVLVNQLLAHCDNMHNRQNSRLVKITGLHLAWVCEEPADRIIREQHRELRFCHSESVNFAVEQSAAGALRCTLPLAFDPVNDRSVARFDNGTRVLIIPMVHRSDIPSRSGGRNAIFIDKHPSHPYCCGLHPAQESHAFAA
jgi:hypothetical protein